LLYILLIEQHKYYNQFNANRMERKKRFEIVKTDDADSACPLVLLVVSISPVVDVVEPEVDEVDDVELEVDDAVEPEVDDVDVDEPVVLEVDGIDDVDGFEVITGIWKVTLSGSINPTALASCCNILVG